jgi:hypothetical protein
MNIKLNWRQSLVITSMIFGGMFLIIIMMTPNPSATWLLSMVGIVAFFSALIALVIWSRLLQIPKSWHTEDRLIERRRILGEVGHGCTRALFVAVLVVAAYKYFTFKISDDEIMAILPGAAVVFWGFAPIIRALQMDDRE